MNRGLEPIAPPEPTRDRTPTPAPLSGEWRTFRVRFGPLYGFGSLTISTACLLFFSPFLFFPLPYSKAWVFVLALAEGCLLAGFTTLVDYFMYSTGVNQEGILIRRSRKNPLYRWDEMENCRCIRLPFIAYVKVRCGRRSLWLPLFHRKQDELERAVREFAPLGNPLRSYFESE